MKLAKSTLHILSLVCPLVIPRGLPEEDLSVLHVVCPLVIPRGLPEEDLKMGVAGNDGGHTCTCCVEYK